MNEFITHFHFLRPWWLLALLPCLVLLMFIWLRFKQSSQWSSVIAAPLLPFLLDGEQIQRRRVPLLGAAALWLITCIALAGPAWQQLPQPVQQNAEAMVVAWDLSPSMLAEDIKPSRLERGRLKLIDLFKSRKDGVTALIAFSGEAYTVAPLTDDVNTLVNLLPALTPTTLPSVGSNPEMALEQAIDLLKAASIQDGSIILLTDGIPEDAFPILDSMAASVPYNVIYWGIGTVDGAPIRLPQGGFAKQANGNIVVAKLNESELRNFAARSGQFYIPVTTNDSDIEAMSGLIFDGTDTTKSTERLFDQWAETGQYLSLLLLPFIALLFRRGWIFIFLCAPFVGLVSMAPSKAEALSWNALWLNKDQRAARSLEKGEADAADQFSTPVLRGLAHTQLDKHEDAARAFAQEDSAGSAYNEGTALTRAGNYEAAIEAFDRALIQQPDFTAAEENKKIAQTLLKLQEQQQQQDQDQSDESESDQSESDKSESEQSESNDSKSSDSNSGESEPSDSQAQNQQNQETESEQKENPYSEAADEAEKKEDEQQATAEQQETPDTENDKNKEEEQQAMLEQQALAEQTEEQQKLQQWLRKVPDDPSGLMRNKFKHQYMERKRKFNATPNEAEQRW